MLQVVALITLKMTKTQERIAEKSEKLQDELHKISENGKKQGSKADYQDYVTAYLIIRIASLEVAIEDILNN